MNKVETTINCFVLMPFEDSFTFVYKDGVEPVLGRLKNELRNENKEITFDCGRADDKLDIKGEKINEIMKKIEKADLVVIDITGNNPNVIWELGFACALEKFVAIISQSTNNLGFNYRGRDVHKYEFSVKGMQTLESELAAKLKDGIEEVLQNKNTLRNEEHIKEATNNIVSAQSKIHINSILKRHVLREMQRVEGRIKSVSEGTYSIRRERPMGEIVDYFCDYIEQLDNDACWFHTITCYDFWNEITESGTNYNFLMSNIGAAKKGTKIQRLFMVDKKNTNNLTYYIKILDDYLKKVGGANAQWRKNFQTKIRLTSCFETDYKTYGNFAIVKKGTEFLLFAPAYTEGKMVKNKIIYYNENAKLPSKWITNKETFEKYAKKFDHLWDGSDTLNHQKLGELRKSLAKILDK